MKTQSFFYEILIVFILSVIPWPGPSVFKISCPRDRASIVRKIIQKKWIPVLKKYQVELPVECPFHASRDIFYPQESAKHQHRSSQWTCGLCGKSFYTEKHLDAHFDNRHRSVVNTGEDAVCLTDYCDIMRCDVLGYHDFENYEVNGANTDLQVWKESPEYKTSLAPCESRNHIRNKCKKYSSSPESHTFPSLVPGDGSQKCCQQRNPKYRGHRELAGLDNKSQGCEKVVQSNEGDDEYKDQNGGEKASGNLVESALPDTGKNRCGRSNEIRWLKSNCKPEELQKLREHCEILIRDCIAGLLTNLSLRDFQEVESELNKAVCWHLSCDRYWEDSRRLQKYIPWYLLTTFLTLLLASLYGCYYIVWVVFNSDENSTETMNASQHRGKHFHEANTSRHFNDRKTKIEAKNELTEFDEETSDPFIYVAYPPELKQRLLENCYNRTTRL